MPQPTSHRTTALIAASLAAALASACSSPAAQPEPQRAVDMANPASTYCISLGGRLEMRKDEAGNQFGLCHLPDGTQIEEWALFRRDHPQAKP